MKKENLSFNFKERLFIGHPLYKTNYSNAVSFKLHEEKWFGDINVTLDSLELFLSSIEDYSKLNWEEERFIRKTNHLLICSESLKDHLVSSNEDYNKIVEASYVLRENKDFKTFFEFTRDIKEDPLPELEEMSEITPELARKYMEYNDEYYKSDYSNKTIKTPYYYTFNNGISIIRDNLGTYKIVLGFDEKQNLKAFKILFDHVDVEDWE